MPVRILIMALFFVVPPGFPDLGEATGNLGGSVNELTPNPEFEERQEEVEEEEEFIERRFEIPLSPEEKEFNQNGSPNP